MASWWLETPINVSTSDEGLINVGHYKGHRGVIESNVHQRTVDFPGEFAVGFHVWLDSGLVVVVRADQVQKSNGLRRRPDPSDNTSE